MGVVCPACGSVSRDEEVCDRCDTDLLRWSRQVPPLLNPFTGETLSLLQANTLNNTRSYLFHQERKSAWRARWVDFEHWIELQPLFRERQKIHGRCLPNCRLHESAGGVWVIAESSPEIIQPWEEAASDDPVGEVERLLSVLRLLATGLEELHAQGLAWLSFSPGALEFVTDRISSRASSLVPQLTHVRFTNLDVHVFAAKKFPHDVDIDPAFSAPEVRRGRIEEIGPRTDVFHLAMFAYYWLARRLPDGFPGEGLDAFGYRVPNIRVYAPQVPLSIPRILAQSLSLLPEQRARSPFALCDALAQSVEKMQRRRSYRGELQWEIGSHTRTGKTKTILGHGNEDHVVVRQFADPDRALVAVADGITTCDIGSGALASLISTILLENSFSDESDAESFPATITEICARATKTLLDWALDKGYRDQLIQGLDLMGTTLTVGWIEHRVLQLANLGDSRAYLVTGENVEQLTVDGDLTNTMLQAGHPPAEVWSLGSMGRSLSKCIGGCVLRVQDNVTHVEDSCQPSLSRWHLLPGDVLVICSDGLVDEGVFLEPAVLVDTIRNNGSLTSQEMAEWLADLADAVQRPPSPLEPEGLGDNISCIVVKISEITR